MKKMLHMLVLLMLVLQPALGVFPGQAAHDNSLADWAGPGIQAGSVPSDPPGWPLPAKPRPYHEPGQRSKAGTYTTQVELLDENGLMETSEISGLDAIVADGLDPLAENYRLVGKDQLLRSAEIPGLGDFGLQTFSISDTIDLLPGSQWVISAEIGDYRINDIAAADLNNDGQAEQIAAWLDGEGGGNVNMLIGEMPGSFGKSTSAPAAVVSIAKIHLLVRGPDFALWHCTEYDALANACVAWENEGGGGVMLSAPAAVPATAVVFDVYAILSDNLVYRRRWDTDNWSGDWQLVDDPAYWQPLVSLVPVPELPAPSVAAHGDQIELFRLGPDNTLRWRHFDGSSWADWQGLGGALASGPAAIVLDSGAVQVFGRGADDALWTRAYQSGWGDWQRVELTGMAEGVGLASSPAALSSGSGQLDVYGRGSDDQLWMVNYNGSAWGSWTSGGGSLHSAVGAVLVGAPYLFALTGSGGLQAYRAGGWEPLGGIDLQPTIVNTGKAGIRRTLEGYQDFSIDLETGYFWGDGRSQIVLGYYLDGTTISVALYDISDSPYAKGFTPEWVTEVVLNGAGEGVGHFRLATGDFLDGDGIDEIAVAYTIGNDGTTFFDEFKYRVELYRFNRDNPSLDFVDDVTINGSDDLSYPFAGTLVPAAGDFDGDGHDELGVMSSWVKQSSYLGCGTNLYWFMMDIFDVDNTGVPPAYDIKRYRAENGWLGEANLDARRYQVSLSMAAGDVDGDGQDEILRTWPTGFSQEFQACLTPWFWLTLGQSLKIGRKAQAVKLPLNADPNVNAWVLEGGFIKDKVVKDMPTFAPTAFSFQDRLAGGDFNRNLKDEVAWLIGDNSTSQKMKAYELIVSGDSSAFVEIASKDEGFTWMPRLVTADFTGESIRVGPPSYRKQYGVGKVIAIVNAPPKHKDVVDGVAYNLNADQAGTYSEFEQVIEEKTEVSVTTHKDWGVDTEFKGTVGDPQASHVTASLEASYGQDFDDENATITTLTFEQRYAAVTDDVVHYVRLDYDVWEYPVYNSLTNAPDGYMSVVWPSGPMKATVEPANMCEGWYRPSHQLMNVWSYPSQPGQLHDRDATDADADGVPDRDLFDEIPRYIIGTSPWDFSVAFNKVDLDKRSFKYDLGIAASLEAQYGGEEVDLQVTKTRLPSLYFSARGEFNYSELAEWTTQTTQDTKLAGYFETIENGTNYLYDVEPYLYWSTNDYLVLNYLDAPRDQWFWSKTSTIYNRPDPAFILPWADGQCTHIPGWQDSRFFSSDITVDPPMAKAGDPVTITARFRNFSNVSNGSLPFNKPFTIAFYHGDPDAGGVKIGERAIEVGQLGPRAELTRSLDWIAAGSGEQHIYVVIDPQGSLTEVHDENDPFVNNNKGYGVLSLDAVEFIDVGQAEVQPYFPVTLTQGEAAPIFGLHVPLAAFNETLRFDLRKALEFQGLDTLGDPFEIQAFQQDWNEPQADFSFVPVTGAPPAVILVDYASADLQGFDENALKLYRFNGIDWEEANRTCGLDAGNQPLYAQARLSSQDRDLLMVPICLTGFFALSDKEPSILIPEAAFSASPLSGVAPLSVKFTDLSLNNPTYWEWDFGDGTAKSYQQDPVHVYTRPGIFTVTLTVNNGFDSDEEIKPAYIAVRAENYLPMVIRQ